MKKHSTSLFLSLLIHSLVLGGVLYIYTALSSQSNKKKAEKKLCLNLQCIKEKKSVSTSVEKKKIEKKIPKKKIKQRLKKKIPKKKLPKKKKVIHKKKVILKKHKPKPKKTPKKTLKAKQIKPKAVQHAEQKAVEKQTDKPVVNKVVKNVDCQMKKSSQTVQKTPKHAEPKEIYINNHLYEITQLIKENLYYPRRARKRGIEGKVNIKFTLLKDAGIKNIQVLNSSHKILSRAAVKTIEELSQKFPKPQEDLVLTIPIVYSLH